MSRGPARPSERRARGREGEDRACEFLATRGFTIVARNHRCARGEVDVVAEQGELVVFVEVRSRTSDRHGTPAETVSRSKRRRVVIAATDWAVRNGVWDRRPMRFDVISVVDRDGGPAIEHLEGAFDASGEPT